MKILNKLVKYAFVASCAFLIVSCANKEEKKAAPALPASAQSQLEIRYIDEDSLLKQYNLAKDINEVMLRKQNQIESVGQQRANEIQKFQGQMAQKYKSNGYLTEESFNADQAKLQKMQADAQAYLEKLQRDGQNEMVQNNIQLNDSIDNFLKIYCKEKGYSVVLRKSATFYIDSKYDVTADVLAGLNKRYNKVEKK